MTQLCTESDWEQARQSGISNQSYVRSTLRLCSLGLGGHSQAVMVTAAVGVSMCGDYIHDPGEYAWPTQNIMAALGDAWGSQHQRSESFSVFEGRPI